MDDLALGQLLLQEGLTSPEQLRELYKALAIKPPGTALAQIAIEVGVLSREKLTELEAIEATQQTVRVPSKKKETAPPPPPLPPPPPPPLSPDEIANATEQTFIERRPAKKATGATGAKLQKVTAPVGDQLPADVAEMINNPDYTFDKFVLVGVLGKGGMGEVWKAWQKDLRRYVAIKFLESGEGVDLERFFREAQTAASLSHPNITALYELNRFEGKYYIVMEFVDGVTLQDQLGKGPVDRAVKTIRDSALALEHAHRHGIIHRDIKPQNIMVAKSGRTYVMDFGLAKQTRSEGQTSNTVAGMILGTPAFMSPEQAEGKFTKMDKRSDVYSLGATMYALVTGEQPVQGRAVMDTLYKVVHGEIIPPRKVRPDLPHEVEAIVLKAMSKVPSHRYQSAREFADDLKRYLDGEPVAASGQGTGRPVKVAPKKSGAGVVVAIIAAVVVVAVLVTALVLKGRGGLKPDPDKPDGDGTSTSKQDGKKAEAQAHLKKARDAWELAEKSLISDLDPWSKVAEKCDEAIAAARKAIDGDPKLAEAPLLAGQAHTLKREWEKAETELKQATTLDGGSASSQAALGRLYFWWASSIDASVESGLTIEADPQRAKSIAPFKKAMELSKDRADASIFEAHAALAARDHVKAADAASRAIQSSERWEAWLLRAIARRRGPRDGKATLADGLEALRRQRNHPGVVEFAAQFTYFAGSIDECRRHCDTLLKLHGQGYAPAYIRRSLCNYTQERDAEALADAEAAIRAAPRSSDAYVTRATVLTATGRFDDALRDANEAVRLSPQSASALNTRAAVRITTKDYTGAIPDLDKAIGLDPSFAGPHFNRGQAYRQLKQFDRALPDYRKSVELEPGNANYFVMLMNCWVAEVKDYTGALDWLSRPNARFPSDQFLLFWAARAQLGLKQYSAALTNLDNAVRLTPNSPDCLRWRAHAHHYLKHVDEAAKDIEQATKLSPQESEFWSDSAIMMREAKRWQDAIDSANRAIQLRPAYKERLDPLIKFCQEQLK